LSCVAINGLLEVTESHRKWYHLKDWVGFPVSSIATMAVSVAVCEIISIKEWCDLENWVRVCSRSLEMAPFDRSHTSCYSRSIVTMAISCIVCEIWRLIGRKSRIFIPHLYSYTSQGRPRRNFVKMFDASKTRMIGLPSLPYGKKTMTIC